MKYGLDMVNPPTPEQARRMAAAGYTFCAVYVGGPRAAARETWQQRDGSRYPVRDIAEHFSDGFLPVYVGKNAPWDAPDDFTHDAGYLNGQEADSLTGACGFNSSTPLALDVEYATYHASREGTLAYISGWIEAVNEAGHPGGVYSDIETLGALALGDQVDFKWGAAWVPRFTSSHAPVGRFDPASPPPWDIWQFAGGTVAGVNVDYNSTTDAFRMASYG